MLVCACGDGHDFPPIWPGRNFAATHPDTGTPRNVDGKEEREYMATMPAETFAGWRGIEVATPTVRHPACWDPLIIRLGLSPRKPDSPATAGLSGFRKVCVGLSGFQIFAASLGEPDSPKCPTATNHRMHNRTIEKS
jgi:hypothetical protein